MILAMLALLMLTCSCVKNEVIRDNLSNLPATVGDSGITGNENSSRYISWVELEWESAPSSRYETELTYTYGLDSAMNVSAKGIEYVSHRFDKEVLIGERRQGNITIYSYRRYYLVRYKDFEVPLSFVTEKAFLENCGSYIYMPVLSTDYSIEQPQLVDLEDETVGDKEYYCYQLTCTATAETGNHLSTTKNVVKIMVEKQPIVFGPPVVNPWEDVEVEVN